MQKAPDTPGMRHTGVLRSFCSNRWGNCWRVNSDVWFCILGLQKLIQQPVNSDVWFCILGLQKLIQQPLESVLQD
jgi:hypothetical protein